MNTEYLAVTAIFLAGFYFGIKIRETSYKLEKYFKSRKAN
jgi:hypothetical protein